MKRIVLLGIVALALAVGLPSVAGASDNDVSGPKCADVIAGTGSYASTGTVNVRITLTAPSCPYVTYTLHVFDATYDVSGCVPGTTELATQSMSGNGVDGPQGTPLLLSTTVDPSNPAVFVYATTSVGRHIFDRAPDAGFAPCMVRDFPPGFGSFD